MAGFRSKGFLSLNGISESLRRRKERKLRNKMDQQGVMTANGPKKIIEAYVAPPSFLLYLWAALPLLMISTFVPKLMIAGVVATLINFLLIHMDTFTFIRYLMSTLVTTVLFALYHFNVI